MPYSVIGNDADPHLHENSYSAIAVVVISACDYSVALPDESCRNTVLEVSDLEYQKPLAEISDCKTKMALLVSAAVLF
jgi:hypothetical protein